ncbi:MAG: phosphoglycerate kinase [Pyrinomonadaceae bacterium]
MSKKTIKNCDLEGKVVFIRVDFNVPVSEGVVSDDTRIRGALDTIRFVRDAGGRTILASHLGRPADAPDPKFSLRPVAARLSELLAGPVEVAEDCVGEKVDELKQALENGQILLLENLRFHAGEKKNDPEFAKELAKYVDVYVNDAFGTAHRAHASTEGITHFVSENVAGLLVERELEVMNRILNNPEHPFVAILGGAKVSDKIPVIKSLIANNVDRLLIGGAMAYTFLRAEGFTIGKSLVEDEMMPMTREIRSLAGDNGVELLLPTDHQVVDSYDPLNSRRVMPIEFTNAGLVGLDIGPETSTVFANALKDAKTIIWNGPMGMFEEKPFDEGTRAVAEAVASSTDAGAFTVVGGGDSVAAVVEAGLSSRISHISTGGGATLELLSGKKLPGIEALDENMSESVEG